ncbi:unnamed protein product, partial [Prorocentrum cordatum]
DGLQRHLDAPAPPASLQNETASNVLEGVESACAETNMAAIRRMLSSGAHVFLSQVPDNHPANRRALARLHKPFDGYHGLLENPIECCAAHQDNLIGDVHARAVVHRSVSHHNQVATALGQILLGSSFEFNVIDEPNEQWVKHTEQVMCFTIGKDARGCIDNRGDAAHEQK